MAKRKDDTTALKVNNIFYSIQGEGNQTGMPAIFIRLAGCNLKCSFCDTEFHDYKLLSLEELHKKIKRHKCFNIIWTGGEPTIQLTAKIISFFKQQGYRQSIETNGMKKVPRGIDYITCSPKTEALANLKETFPRGVQELRFPIGLQTPYPPSIESLPKAQNYYISPIDDDTIYPPIETLERCIKFIKKNPQWRLNLQTHKLIGIE